MKKAFKILIVDDEPLIAHSLKLAGESLGHITKIAFSAEEALDIWSSFKPDLAFIDILMSGMSGLDLLKKIPKASTKTVLISAHDKLNEEEIKTAGADLFIKKPFEDIFKIIQKAEKLMLNTKT
ncbi:MAG: response regulator [Bdellovibrionaceae bacterium]|nr:response regulator [Pseudobdellovibrionaceae bacterium]